MAGTLSKPSDPKSKKKASGAHTGKPAFFGRRFRVLAAIATIAVILVAFLAFEFLASFASAHEGVETQSVRKGRLLVTLASEGNIQSARNLELKCQVAGGGKIISIVPDGTIVEAGAELVQLDRSMLEQQLDEQKILYERAVATKIQAEQDYAAAEIAVREYLDGTYHKDVQAAESLITVARQTLEADRNVLSHTERMFRKGFVTALQLEADKFAVEHAQLDLDSALLAQKVLQDFTKAKTVKLLEAVRDAADARRKAEQASVELERTKLVRLKLQLTHCVIKAPQGGLVLYANDPGRRGGGGQDSPQVEEGAMVRERQTIIRLPDLHSMQVETSVHEAHVPRIRPGMPARINVLGRTWNGRVKSIASRPMPPQRYSAPTKNYSVIVAIDGDIAGLKPGMTAEVEILVVDLHDVCTVPVAAVVEEQGQYYAWVKNPTGPCKEHVTIGMTDDRVIEIKQGLAVGDQVITNPRATVPEAMHFEAAEQHAAEDDSRFQRKAKEAEPKVAPGNQKGLPAVSQRSF